MTTTFLTDKDMHKAFKAKCHANEKSISETLTKLMSLYSKHGEKLFKDKP